MNKHIKKLNKLHGIDFWKYFLENKNELKLILDNDDTIVVLVEHDGDDEEDREYASANNYLGNNEGITELLHALEVNCEHC